ncbi:serine/threonine-protein kinase HipA [Salinibacterium sp. CAN_S4]|uniref:type II toxin-antitoxin system HipA family toxin n=1 Tax=Salinibacterium sp. CAN_S4 TaxID=2787727 RepID=UPI0018F037D1
MVYESARVVEVRIWGTRVGAVSGTTRGYGFEYSPEWKRGAIELSPLLMPTTDRRGVFSFRSLSDETFYGLPPMLADALPDRFGNSIVDAWLATQGVGRSEISALDRLAYLGSRGMGALEFVPDRGPNAPDPTALDLGRLIEAARAVMAGTLADEVQTGELLHQIISVGTSAGGARAKAVVNINDATQEIRAGHTMPGPGEQAWLLKFDGVGADRQLGESQQYTRIEYAYSLMVRAAGLTMAPTRLLAENGRSHFLTRRFDREPNTRIHMQSLCGLSAVDFNLRETNDYSQLFTAAQQLGLGEEAMTEIFGRMAFNVAAANHDDHSKNHSFLLRENGNWELAPAYDVTYARDAKSVWPNQHLMSVNGKFHDISRADLLAVADRFAIPGAKKAISAVADALDAWPEFAAEAQLDNAVIDSIASEFADLRR